ncbi:MAG: guanine deaminase [Cyanobacteria bacterium]|nr:guanine deaminase [Cyanobacteriota bacterium]
MTTLAVDSVPHGFRGAILDFVGDPFYGAIEDCVRYWPDGLLVVAAGRVVACGAYDDLQGEFPNLDITAYPHRLLMPGFIDTHIHFPQMTMMAAYGEQLLAWLERYTFPIEAQFKDPAFARPMADRFLTELLRHGTTTALVLAAVFPESAEVLFEAAAARNLRLIAGKVMMDRNAPDYLLDTATDSYADSRRLIETWHKRGRLLYAVTPRFAVTSTPEQLSLAGKLLQEFPDVYLHTHLSENVDEVALVKATYPDHDGYLDVYDRAGLVGDRSIFAHGVQLTEAEFARLSEAGAAIAFCPSSNLFLGSGCFPIEKAKSTITPIKVGLGSDVGAGTSFSILQTAQDAYKVAQLRRQKLSAFQGLFLATLGGARALNLEAHIGNFLPGKEADFVVLDPCATPALALRHPNSLAQNHPVGTVAPDLETVADLAFALMLLGDDRAITATYILGELAYDQSA